MKVAIYSKQLFEQKRTGWHRGGESILYYSNNITKDGSSPYYSLTFSYTFPYSNDEVYFAYSVPYTYTRL